MHQVKLNLTLIFSEEAYVTEKDKKIIIDNVLASLINTINTGGGIAPNEALYTTDYIYIEDKDDKSLNLLYNCIQERFV